MRTRIKICGITRPEDLEAAAGAGVDALGFVAYPKSPRYVGPERAAALAELVPPFVTCVVLFVNASRDEIAAYLDLFPSFTLQFHGDELAHACEETGNQYIKAARIQSDGRVAGQTIDEFAAQHPRAQAVLLDAFSDSYGGTGRSFDWAQATQPIGKPMILSGGLTPENVGEGIARLHPWAVDVSSGVEKAKGIKDAGKIRAFCNAVRAADRALAGE